MSQVRTGCVECGRPEEAHPVKYATGGSCKIFKSMALPAGFTCVDCQFFRFCSHFIGPEIAGNTQCDWYPIRFVPKLPLPPSADRQKEQLTGTVNSASPDSEEKKEGAE